jgi:hypothetical protein
MGNQLSNCLSRSAPRAAFGGKANQPNYKEGLVHADPEQPDGLDVSL